MVDKTMGPMHTVFLAENTNTAKLHAGNSAGKVWKVIRHPDGTREECPAEIYDARMKELGYVEQSREII